ncbi:MAG: Crp/Fnr family transcriptional regulator [Phascolarctobacterium sp.]|nr:Crp/Fnr family transcriptional regulator [Phascolarctobacterium sp.]
MNAVVVVSSQCPFWNDLTNEEKVSVLKSAQVEKLKKGEEVSSYGAIFLTKGLIRGYVITEEGKELTIGHLLPGDIGVMPCAEATQDLQFEVSLEASENVEFVKIPLSVMENLQARNPKVAMFILRVAAQRYVQAINTMQTAMSKSLEARIAEYLYFRSESNDNLVLKLTHEDIARCISSSREVVTKEMKKMVAAGLVELRRGVVIIKDIRKLQNVLDTGRYSLAG